MALHALSSNKCQDHFEKYTIAGVEKTDCASTPELASNFDAYLLNIEGEYISISLNNQEMQNTLKELGKDSDMAALENKFTEYCKVDRPDANGICKLYRDNKEFAEKLEKSIASRKEVERERAKRIASLKTEGPNYLKSGTKSFIKALLNNSAPLIQSFFALQAQETQTANQLYAIQSYDTAYKNSMNNYLNSNDPNNSQYYASWGAQNLGTNYQALSTFQNSNQSFAFGDPNNPFKYSFNIPGAVTTNSLIQTTLINQPPAVRKTDSFSVFFLATR